MKKLPLFILSSLFGLIPLFVFAHGNAYLEFSPDQSDSLRVADVATPSQTFFVQNDFLGGVDFWVANPGASGFATLTLLNDSGSTLTSRTVTIPTIAETTNGTRFHIDFNSQLSVLADARYSIRITSSMPELRLYYSDRINLVSYNTPFVSEYITGVGKLGSEEQVFSFKHTLYETQETSAPIISNLGWTVISSNEMRVDFNANEPVDYKIDYGPSGQGNTASTNFLGSYQFCASGIATCKINIQVSPNTNYQYTLTVKDSWGNQSQSTGTFASGQVQTPTPTVSVTPPPTGGPSPTTTPTVTVSASPTPNLDVPAISNLRVVNITNNSADIAWTTDASADSYILVSREVDFSLIITSALDSTFELEHLLNTGEVLNAGTIYLVRVRSTNMTGESTASISFTTLAHALTSPSPSATPLTSSAPSPTPQVTTTSSPSSDGTSTGIIDWSPPAGGEPSDGYRVDIFDKDGKLIKTVLVPAGAHSADVPELTDGEYQVIVYTNNDGVFEKVDKPAQLKVGEPTFVQRLLGFWPYLLIVVILVGVFGWMRFRKIKNVNIKVENDSLKS